ncbi:MAG: squalene--hopene cyclase [Bacteroidales bacterium]|nr:squalene--hopene cyclase [Bacteroidales bacterium]
MLSSEQKDRLEKARNKVSEDLRRLKTADGYWEGRLSDSALATAVAIFAMYVIDQQKYAAAIEKGRKWLEKTINKDGGWGDSPESKSNLSTTLLCWSALAPFEDYHTDVIKKVEGRIKEYTGGLTPEALITSILKIYGKDRTFSVPILCFCALAGRLGKNPWSKIPQLPFEMAILPPRFFKRLRLQVVSYALPALIAMGILIHRKKKSNNILGRWIRKAVTKRCLKKLENLQPASGGFLEAIPLTGFVLMSLASVGLRENQVVKKGVNYLENLQREDGGWPIDINLSTWVTTLTINSTTKDDVLIKENRDDLCGWILKQQFTQKHIFTNADPGGWGWTNQPGSVPDADDTSGALLALHVLSKDDEKILQAVRDGISWLVNLQNKDGGFPTFCKGWGKLPFDKSCADITAHAIQAFAMWHPNLDNKLKRRVQNSLAKALEYLKKSQDEDGSWCPLWFGNQYTEGELNKVYGTSKVLIALKKLENTGTKVQLMIESADDFLLNNQGLDGGWGSDENGMSTTEETSLALCALTNSSKPEHLDKGYKRLIELIENGSRHCPTPIGLYFASLWYSEQMYPLVYGYQALNMALKG